MRPGQNAIWRFIAAWIVSTIFVLAKSVVAVDSDIDFQTAVQAQGSSKSFADLVENASRKQMDLWQSCPQVPLACPEGAVMLLAPTKFSRLRRTKCRRAGCVRLDNRPSMEGEDVKSSKRSPEPLAVVSAIAVELKKLDGDVTTPVQFDRHLSRKAAERKQMEKKSARDIKHALANDDHLALQVHLAYADDEGITPKHMQEAREVVHRHEFKLLLEVGMRAATESTGDLSELQRAIDHESRMPLVHHTVTDANRLLNGMRVEEKRRFVSEERPKFEALLAGKDRKIAVLRSTRESLTVSHKDCSSALSAARADLNEQRTMHGQAEDVIKKAMDTTDKLAAFNVQLSDKQSEILADIQALVGAIEAVKVRFESLEADQKVLTKALEDLGFANADEKKSDGVPEADLGIVHDTAD